MTLEDTQLPTSTRIASSLRIWFFCKPPFQLNRITFDKRRTGVRSVVSLSTSSSPWPSVSTNKAQLSFLTRCTTLAICTPFVHTPIVSAILNTSSPRRQFMRNDLPCLAGPRIVTKLTNTWAATSGLRSSCIGETSRSSLIRVIHGELFLKDAPWSLSSWNKLRFALHTNWIKQNIK